MEKYECQEIQFEQIALALKRFVEQSDVQEVTQVIAILAMRVNATFDDSTHRMLKYRNLVCLMLIR